MDAATDTLFSIGSVWPGNKTIKLISKIPFALLLSHDSKSAGHVDPSHKRCRSHSFSYFLQLFLHGPQRQMQGVQEYNDLSLEEQAVGVGMSSQEQASWELHASHIHYTLYC